MSTRATYKFVSPRVVYYVHDGNWLAGAAERFYQMHLAYSYNLATSFFRANPDAEVTHSHEHHGDTEYRFEVSKDGGLMVQERRDNQWVGVFCGDYHGFINEHHKKPFEPLKKFRLHEYSGEIWANKPSIQKYLNEARLRHDEYKQKFPHMTGNISSLWSMVERYEKILEKWEEI